ncbi:MAG: FHA domain-containing protein [Magnetococcales bacterium]|nr:FHA domain-containing protein [Magnetococcales bacterium]
MSRAKNKASIQRYMASNGRVDYRDLEDLAKEYNEQRFVQMVRYHCLVGVQVLQGALEDDPDDADSTKLFTLAKGSFLNSQKKRFDLTKVVFPLIPGQNSPENELIYVGQDDGNNIVISDYSISHDHLSVRIDNNGRYFMRDLGAKNGTKLNDEVCSLNIDIELNDDDVIQIGRYQFIFLSPSMLYARLKGFDIKESLAEMVNSLGKADYKLLKEMADCRQEGMFVQLVHYPALVGLALFKGYLVEAANQSQAEDSDETKLFLNEDRSKLKSVTMEYLSRNIFPIAIRPGKVKGRDVLTIGRAETNDLCMVDNSISRVHAQIRIAGEGHYFFADTNSRNGSWINGKKLCSEEVALCEGDKVKIGRFLFTFAFPSTLYNMLRSRKKK